jgi:hypothetical protein
MKLKKWLKYVDPIVDVKIFEGEEEDPVFEGPLFDIPWGLTEHEIGRVDNTDKDEPIFICSHVNQYNVELPLIVINIK